ncbi:MAG TPA: hypothetical protein VH396_19890 [Chitinophagaceae bacterium]|jgi:hypothetical protein
MPTNIGVTVTRKTNHFMDYVLVPDNINWVIQDVKIHYTSTVLPFNYPGRKIILSIYKRIFCSGDQKKL